MKTNRMLFYLSLMIIGFTMIITSCDKDNDDDNDPIPNLADSTSFTDARDGQKYKKVRIGKQTWMAENLAYLPSVSPPSEGSVSEDYYYVYGYHGNDVIEAKSTNNYQTLGVLYNWSAAMDGASSSGSNPSGVQGACSSGWHLPSSAEWDELVSHLGGASGAGGKMKEEGTTHWTSPNVGATNSSGFLGLPGGARDGDSNNFVKADLNCYFWVATEYDSSHSWWRGLSYFDVELKSAKYHKEPGFSIRCIKD